jgi:hypothetical protein
MRVRSLSVDDVQDLSFAPRLPTQWGNLISPDVASFSRDDGRLA